MAKAIQEEDTKDRPKAARGRPRIRPVKASVPQEPHPVDAATSHTEPPSPTPIGQAIAALRKREPAPAPTPMTPRGLNAEWSKDLSTIGKRMVWARRRMSEMEGRDIVQMDVAKWCGVARPSYAQWETDLTTPSIDKVFTFSKYLRVPPEFIAFGIDREQLDLRSAKRDLSLIEDGELQADGTFKPGNLWGIPNYILRLMNAPDAERLRIVTAPNDIGTRIKSGSPTLVDVGVNSVTGRGYYLVEEEGVLRVYLLMPGSSPEMINQLDEGQVLPLPASSMRILARVIGSPSARI